MIKRNGYVKNSTQCTKKSGKLHELIGTGRIITVYRNFGESATLISGIYCAFLCKKTPVTEIDSKPHHQLSICNSSIGGGWFVELGDRIGCIFTS